MKKPKLKTYKFTPREVEDMIEKGLLVLPYTKGLVGDLTVEVTEGENGDCVGNVTFIYTEGT